MTSRLFVALDLPEKAINEIVELRNSIYGKEYKRVKWEPEEKLHITLKFLGDVSEERIKSIENQLEKISSEFESFDIELTKFGIFYNFKHPRILWIGSNTNNSIVRLQSEVENGLEELGYEKEKRKFKTHLTLLRVKGNEDFEKLENFRQVEFKPVKFRARKISLIKSELKPTGSVYRIIKSFNLI